MWVEAIRDGVKVRIVDIKTTDADPNTEILIIYADADGVLHFDDDMSNFCVCE